MKYSVIIPAYQAEKTISRCLDSLLAGIRDDTEILVINDGSTDRTHEICMDYAEKYGCILYFRQLNKGVSAARNVGLSHACGEYILFVDSDDFVSPGLFAEVDQKIFAECDFMMFGSAVFDGTKTRKRPLRNGVIHTPQDMQKFICKYLIRQRLNAPFAKVFRRQILVDHDIRFDERLPIGEDKVFVVQYLVHARNAVMIREPLYTLSVENKRSLSQKQRKDICDHILLEHQLLFEAAKQYDYRSQLKKAVCYSYDRSAYTVMRELHKFDYSRQQRQKQTRQICRRYAQYRECVYWSLWHWLMSLPLRLQMAGLIDFLLRKKR